MFDWPQAYELRGAGAVLHSHSLNAVLATLIDETAKEFKVTHLEMIKVRTQALCMSGVFPPSGHYEGIYRFERWKTESYSPVNPRALLGMGITATVSSRSSKTRQGSAN